MSDLSIQIIPSEIKKEDKRAGKLNPKLPKPPFLFCLVGSAGTGKSSVIYTVVNKWYKNYFDYVLVYNGVGDANEAFLGLNDKKTTVQVLNDWNPETFDKWLKTVESENNKLDDEGVRKRNVLVVMDDMITHDISKHHSIGIMDRAIQNRRHYNLSIMVSTQSYKQMNRSMRSLNCSSIIITGVNNTDLELIAEEHQSPFVDKDGVIKLYKESMNDGKYGKVFVINYKTAPIDRYQINFDKVLRLTKKNLSE